MRLLVSGSRVYVRLRRISLSGVSSPFNKVRLAAVVARVIGRRDDESREVVDVARSGHRRRRELHTEAIVSTTTISTEPAPERSTVIVWTPVVRIAWV